MKCTTEDCFNPVENRDTGLCASCGRAVRKSMRFKAKKPAQPMPKVSKKMKASMALYVAKKKVWIKGKKCAVYPHLPAVDVHHMKGRTGELLLDERHWLPVSREGHIEIEKKPLWAKEMGYSDYRLTK